MGFGQNEWKLSVQNGDVGGGALLQIPSASEGLGLYTVYTQR